MKCTLIIIFFFIGFKGFNQKLKIGDKITPIQLNSLWPENQKLQLKNGQLLLLDFWGTWCAPCIGVFPKLQEFKDKYEKSGLVVATLTDEPAEKVTSFFKKPKFANFNFLRLIDSTVLGSAEGVTFKSFGITTVPFTIIVDADLSVKWVGTTHDLKETTLEGLILKADVGHSKPEITLQQKSDIKLLPFDTVRIDGFTIITRQVYKESNNKMYNDFPEAGPVINSFKGLPLPKLLQHYYRVYPAQIKINLSENAPLPILSYQIRRENGATWSKLAQVTNDVLSKKLGYNYSIENRHTEVVFLKVKDEKKLRTAAAPFDSTNGKHNEGVFQNEIVTRNYSIQMLLELLEREFNQEIFIMDEIPLSLQKSYFDFEIPKNSMEQLIERLKTYGISVERKVKEIPFINLNWH